MISFAEVSNVTEISLKPTDTTISFNVILYDLDKNEIASYVVAFLKYKIFLNYS